MFAIVFDLVVAETEQHHPKGVTQAYVDIGATLRSFSLLTQYVTYAHSVSNSGRILLL